MSDHPALVPELAITDLTKSLNFWRDLIGFTVDYSRPDEGFAYLTMGGAHLMLDEIAIGRSWLTGDLEHPLGRGINFEIAVQDLEPALRRLHGVDWPLFLAPEEKWYRADKEEIGVRQFLVQDPDGYLLRLQTDIGRRPLQE
ncbi:bleomycin resistance protein [Nesterenkonia muleiensis]|uniref:bleomycin resistance protein n=1 Tax=Nesterenkonia muleiensis TaxID=2282648 RepID=UPI000E708A3C|nr:VOC family protein [Nesterenkonia muleiensis]